MSLYVHQFRGGPHDGMTVTDVNPFTRVGLQRGDDEDDTAKLPVYTFDPAGRPEPIPWLTADTPPTEVRVMRFAGWEGQTP